MDVLLRITRTPGPPELPDAATRRMPAKAVSALKSAGLACLLGKDEAGNDIAAAFDHDVAVAFIADLPLADGTWGGPHLMVRFVSATAKAAWLKAAKPLPDGVEIVANPGTVGWA